MNRLLIGYDGSPPADAAVDDLVHACLPAPVEALVLSVADVWLPPEASQGGAAKPGPSEPPGGSGSERAFGWLDRDPYAKARSVLDDIFLGARGLNHGGHWLLGSVASAVASRAHCSVEIVRRS